MSCCNHAVRITSGQPGRHVVHCKACGVEFDRTNQEAWDHHDELVERFGGPAAMAAAYVVSNIEAGKLGFGRKIRP